MNTDAALENLLSFGLDEWIGLWMIVDEVEQEFNLDDENDILEATVALVKGLLKRGFLAGDSPAYNDGVHFRAWLDQDPEAITALIRGQWTQRGDFPSWGDGPWFALPRERYGTA